MLLGIKEIDTQLRALGKLRHETLEIESEQEKANTYAHEVIPVMDRLRAAVDGLEVLVDRDHWPVPTYNDILFYVLAKRFQRPRLCRGRLFPRKTRFRA